ncbi:MAG: helix-turn-helix transcriptional regulator [Candidatus Pacebacteria bacterium]|nr:helix-turn-helix transcriptional regulator [Candidatus Paceibacterota bacterium]
MNRQLLTKFGRRVREERLKKDLSQEKLAALAKVHRTYIGMIERAEKNITLTNMEKIARALGVRIGDLTN